MAAANLNASQMNEPNFSEPCGKAWNEIWTLCQNPEHLATLGASLIGGDGQEIRIKKNRDVLTLWRADDRVEILARVGTLGIRRFRAEWSNGGEVHLFDLRGRTRVPASGPEILLALISELS